LRNLPPIGDAIGLLDSLLDVAGVQMVEVGRDWPELNRLCIAHTLTANDVPDAWIAAAVKTSGSHLVTFDRGFRSLLTRSELTILEI